MYGFQLVVQQKRETCDSKNGKRARGMRASHRLTLLVCKLALCSSPLPSLSSFPVALSTVEKLHPLRGASLRSAPRSSRQGSPERAKRRSPKKPLRTMRAKCFQRRPREAPRDATDDPFREPQRDLRRPSQDPPPEAPREAPFLDPYGCQHVWFFIGFTIKNEKPVIARTGSALEE